VHVDTALNLLWLTLGVLALAGTLRARRGNTTQKSRAPIRLHICGIALIAATLFPYISATDDVLRIQHMELQQKSTDHRDQAGKKGTSDALIRLFEAMDTPIVGAVREIAFTLFFVSFVVIPALRLSSYIAPFRCGRSPPLAMA
jgi:hypothetical protein